MSKWGKFEPEADNSVGDIISTSFEDYIFYPVWDYIFMPLDFRLKDQVENSMLGIQP